VVITGPESSGKTTLSNDLGVLFGIHPVPEIARKYLSEKKGTYLFEDLKTIANLQMEAAIYKKNRFNLIISDTDLLTILIWSLDKFGKCDPWIKESLAQNLPDLYILCKPDMPWQDDILRENPNDRWRLYHWYKKEIDSIKVPSLIVSGDPESRVNLASEHILAL
jgi:nicotinamide riboside kinase